MSVRPFGLCGSWVVAFAVTHTHTTHKHARSQAAHARTLTQSQAQAHTDTQIWIDIADCTLVLATRVLRSCFDLLRLSFLSRPRRVRSTRSSRPLSRPNQHRLIRVCSASWRFALALKTFETSLKALATPTKAELQVVSKASRALQHEVASGSELELVIENTFIRSAYAESANRPERGGQAGGAHLPGAGSPKTKQGPDVQQRRL